MAAGGTYKRLGGDGPNSMLKVVVAINVVVVIALALVGGAGRVPSLVTERWDIHVVDPSHDADMHTDMPLGQCGSMGEGIGPRFGGREGCSLGQIYGDSSNATIVENAVVDPLWKQSMDRSLLISHWNEARKMWGMRPIKDLSWQISLVKRWMFRAYDANCISEKYKVIYYRIWKSANDNIRFNFEDCQNKIREYDPRHVMRPDVCIFTFVRHPISHFVAAYAEMEQRMAQLREKRPQTRPSTDQNTLQLVMDDADQSSISTIRIYRPENDYGLGTTDRAMAFIISTLSLEWMGKILPSAKLTEMTGMGYPWNFNGGITHILPQSAAVSTFRPDFVGHLENFKDDFNLLQNVCDFELDHDWDRQKGQHKSESDPLGANEAMTELISNNPKVMRTLCLMLYNDFIVFGYSFPSVCSDIAPPSLVSG